MPSDRKIVVVGGSTGSGESTITQQVINRIPGSLRLVTATTRPPRESEHDGVDYFFLTEDEFQKKIAQGDFLEHTHIPERKVRYGTLKSVMVDSLKRATVLFVNTDIVGMRYYRDHYDAATIFIRPSSIKESERRIKVRNPSMSLDEITARLKYAQHELSIEAPYYDHQVTNADGRLNETVDKVIEILKKEGYLEK